MSDKKRVECVNLMFAELMKGSTRQEAVVSFKEAVILLLRGEVVETEFLRVVIGSKNFYISSLREAIDNCCIENKKVKNLTKKIENEKLNDMKWEVIKAILKKTVEQASSESILTLYNDDQLTKESAEELARDINGLIGNILSANVSSLARLEQEANRVRRRVLLLTRRQIQDNQGNGRILTVDLENHQNTTNELDQAFRNRDQQPAIGNNNE